MGKKLTKERDTLYTNADKFINLANTLAQEDKSGAIGAALRYASARYSAYEVSLVAEDMAKEKEQIKETLFKDYAMMIEENLQVYINHIAAQKLKNED